MINSKHNIYCKVVATIATVMAAATAHAQVPGSALDYMLQRPRVSKVYKHKRPMDHLFVDAGAGINLMGVRDNTNVGAMGAVGIGDWITPEHGFRIGASGGTWRIGDSHIKYVDVAADYLINITAVAAPGKYYTPRRFEFIGLAGVDYAFSRDNGRHEHGLGIHAGLRGQIALSDFAYAYVEPRMGLVEDQVSQVYTWHQFRPHGSVSVGLGYRLPDTRRQNTSDERGGAANGLFVSMAGGPAMLTNSTQSTWSGRFGGRAMASVGKWFGHYNALRLSAVASSIYQNNAHNPTKALGLQLDYMANLHNVFGGVNPNRRFWLDLVAGVSYNRSADDSHNAAGSFGYGGGLQANIRLSRSLNLTIEPRMDVYGRDFAPATTSWGQRDAVASVLAGLTYTYNSRSITHAEDADDIRHSAITVVAGAANRIGYMGNAKMYAPIGRISYSRWYAPALAWRASVQGLARGKKVMGYNFAQAVAGADWMADLTAMSCGYDITRPLSFKVLAGVNLGIDYAKNAAHRTYFSPDVHVGGQMAARVSNNVHFVVEPQVGYEMSRRLSPSRVGRFMPSLAVGLEYSMRRSDRKGDPIDRPAKRQFVSASVGTGLYTGNYGEMGDMGHRMSFVGEVGYGRWLGGISGVHASIANTTVRRAWSHGNHNITSLSAGYMANIKAAATGEQTDADLFQLTATADLSLVGASHSNLKTKITMGGKLALQAGFRVSRSVELYVEPAAVFYGKGVEFSTAKNHPFEGEARVSIGTKYHF